MLGKFGKKLYFCKILGNALGDFGDLGKNLAVSKIPASAHLCCGSHSLNSQYNIYILCTSFVAEVIF